MTAALHNWDLKSQMIDIHKKSILHILSNDTASKCDLRHHIARAAVRNFVTDTCCIRFFFQGGWQGIKN